MRKYSKELSVNERKVLWGCYVNKMKKEFKSFEHYCKLLVDVRNIFKQQN